MMTKLAPANLIYWSLGLLPLAAAAPHGGLYMAMFILAVLLLIAIAAADAWLVFSKLDGVKVSLPEVIRISMARPGTLPFRFQNDAKLSLDLQVIPDLDPTFVSEEEQMLFHLPDSEFSRCDWPITPSKRGRYGLRECVLQLRSPLGMWSTIRHQELCSEVRVYPNLHAERKKLAAALLNRGVIGAHLQRVRGQGREFEKLREYVPGDSFDIISWKATAKRHMPISKDFQIEQTQDIYVVIDQSRLSRRRIGDSQALEFFISSALALGLVTEKQGDLFGLLVFDDQVRKFIRARGGRSHHLACREAVFCLEPQHRSPDYGELFSYIKANLRRRSLLLFLTDIDEPTHQESFLQHVRLVSGKHLCLVLSVQEKYVEPLFERDGVADLAELYQHLAGHLNWSRFFTTQRSLQSMGVGLKMVKPDELTTTLIGSYLDVKRRQQL